MLVVNRLLDDDHSSIRLNNLEHVQTLDFCGLVFNCTVENGAIQVRVARSFLKNVNPGDRVVKINNAPVLDFLVHGAKKYIKRTYSSLTALKKYALFMCL